jgi:hypothetical protein
VTPAAAAVADTAADAALLLMSIGRAHAAKLTRPAIAAALFLLLLPALAAEYAEALL